jgi:hypothetical protein
MALVVVVGVGLIAYSRNENLNPVQVGPTATDHWQAAYAIDVCGTMEPALAANTNLTSVGIRTFGDGLIDIDPSIASSDPSAYDGLNATLGKFASSYPGFKLTSTSIELPGKHAKTYSDGQRCAGPLKGKATLVAKVWSSPTAKGAIATGSVTAVRLTNGQMITLAFVPPGSAIPEPSSRSTLLQALGTSSTSTTAPKPTSSTKATTSSSKASASSKPASSSKASASSTKG